MQFRSSPLEISRLWESLLETNTGRANFLNLQSLRILHPVAPPAGGIGASGKNIDRYLLHDQAEISDGTPLRSSLDPRHFERKFLDFTTSMSTHQDRLRFWGATGARNSITLHTRTTRCCKTQSKVQTPPSPRKGQPRSCGADVASCCTTTLALEVL